MEGIDVEMPPETWSDSRGDRSFLKSTLWLNGLPLHLEAVAIEDSPEGLLVAADQQDEERLEALEAMYATRWETLEIGDPEGGSSRRYVVYAVPYGE